MARVPGVRRSTAMVAIVVAVTLIVAASCSRDDGTGTTGTVGSSSTTGTLRPLPSTKTCHPTAPVPPTNQVQTISYQGKDRTYILSVPPGYDGTTSAPVVFDFYGRSGDAQERVGDYELDDQATAAGMLVVTPQADPDRDTAKNAWSTDIPLISEILQSLQQRWCIDDHAVFASGFSDGGVFAAYLGCELPGVFAAIGTVAEVDYPPHCIRTDPPFSVIGFHGKSDPLVPYTGGATDDDDGRSGLPGFPSSLPPSRPVERTFALFARHDGCNGGPSTSQYAAGVERSVYGGCPAGIGVELYSIDDGVHEWPGDPGVGPPPPGSIDANLLMIEFFLAHPKP